MDTPRVLTVTADPDLQATCEAARARPDPALPLDDPDPFWDELAASEPDLVIIDRDIPHPAASTCADWSVPTPAGETLPYSASAPAAPTRTPRATRSRPAPTTTSPSRCSARSWSPRTDRLDRFRLQRLIADADPLTGLANRRRLEERIGRFLAISRRLGLPLSVAVLNVTGLDEVNQDYGLAVGDAVLRQLRRHLARTFRHDRVLARVSGAQFVLARLGSAAADTAARLAEAIRRFAERRGAGLGHLPAPGRRGHRGVPRRRRRPERALPPGRARRTADPARGQPGRTGRLGAAAGDLPRRYADLGHRLGVAPVRPPRLAVPAGVREHADEIPVGLLVVRVDRQQAQQIAHRVVDIS